MEESYALSVFSALSNATRLRILKCLVNAGKDGLPAGEIAEAVDATPSRASFHLAALGDTGLLISTRQSRQITYRVDFAAIGGLVRFLMEDCCQNNEIVRSCCISSGDCRSL